MSVVYVSNAPGRGAERNTPGFSSLPRFLDNAGNSIFVVTRLNLFSKSSCWINQMTKCTPCMEILRRVAPPLLPSIIHSSTISKPFSSAVSSSRALPRGASSIMEAIGSGAIQASVNLVSKLTSPNAHLTAAPRRHVSCRIGLMEQQLCRDRQRLFFHVVQRKIIGCPQVCRERIRLVPCLISHPKA
jgi:hypothetical protein